MQLYCRARGEGVLINLTTRVVRLFCRAVSGKTLKTKITNAMQLYSSAENRKLAWPGVSSWILQNVPEPGIIRSWTVLKMASFWRMRHSSWRIFHLATDITWYDDLSTSWAGLSWHCNGWLIDIFKWDVHSRLFPIYRMGPPSYKLVYNPI